MADTPRAFSVAAHPDGRFAYATHAGGGLVSAYRVDASTGLLAHLDADATTAGIQDLDLGGRVAARMIATHPSGRVVYVTDANARQFFTIPVDAATGALGTPSATTSLAGVNTRALGVDPSGTGVFVVDEAGEAIVSRVVVDAATGLPVPSPSGAPSPSVKSLRSGNCVNLAVDAKGRAYLPCSQDQLLHALALGDDAGSVVDMGTAAAGVSPLLAAVHPTAAFAYASNFGTQTLRTFALSATGAPTLVGTPLDIDIDIDASCRADLFDATGRHPYLGCDARMLWLTVDAATVAATVAGNVGAGRDSGYSMVLVNPPL